MKKTVKTVLVTILVTLGVAYMVIVKVSFMGDKMVKAVRDNQSLSETFLPSNAETSMEQDVPDQSPSQEEMAQNDQEIIENSENNPPIDEQPEYQVPVSKTLLQGLVGQNLYFEGIYGASVHVYSHGDSLNVKFDNDTYFGNDDVASASCASDSNSFKCTTQPAVYLRNSYPKKVLMVTGKYTQDYTEIRISATNGNDWYSKTFTNTHN